MFKLKKAFGYVDSKGLFGEVLSINLQNDEVSLKATFDESEEVMTFDYDDVEILPQIFYLDDIVEDIYSKDVFINRDNSRMYMIDLKDENTISFELLGDNLEPTGLVSHIKLNNNSAEHIRSRFSFVDHYYNLQLLKNPDFNIEIVKEYKDGYFTYYYACNNKNNEEIDLIKVIFVGEKVTEEEYERATVDYDTYGEMKRNGELLDVSQQELRNYALGLFHGNKEVNKACPCRMELISECHCVDEFVNNIADNNVNNNEDVKEFDGTEEEDNLWD